MALRPPSFLVGLLVCLWWPAVVYGIGHLIGACASRADFVSVLPYLCAGLFFAVGLTDGWITGSGRARSMGIVARALADAAPAASFLLVPFSFSAVHSFGDDLNARELRVAGFHPPVAIAVWAADLAIVCCGWGAVRRHRPVAAEPAPAR